MISFLILGLIYEFTFTDDAEELADLQGISKDEFAGTNKVLCGGVLCFAYGLLHNIILRRAFGNSTNNSKSFDHSHNLRHRHSGSHHNTNSNSGPQAQHQRQHVPMAETAAVPVEEMSYSST